MDYIYVPLPTDELSEDQIEVVNELRERLIQSDRITSANVAVKEKVAKFIEATDSHNVLEWGCGYRTLRPYLSGVNYIGVDLDPKVVTYHKAQGGITCLSAANTPLDLPSESFDAIPSVFVFHYRIPPEHISEMFRLIKPQGFLLANVYRRTRRSRKLLETSFLLQGFRVYRRKDRENLCHEHEYWLIQRNDSTIDAESLLMIL
jgi:SAM-dependent methyltransferase